MTCVSNIVTFVSVQSTQAGPFIILTFSAHVMFILLSNLISQWVWHIAKMTFQNITKAEVVWHPVSSSLHLLNIRQIYKTKLFIKLNYAELFFLVTNLHQVNYFIGCKQTSLNVRNAICGVWIHQFLLLTRKMWLLNMLHFQL